jgi:hypothetical protein
VIFQKLNNDEKGNNNYIMSIECAGFCTMEILLP